MYKAIIRPLLFLFDPEKVHHVVVFLVRVIAGIPILNKLIGQYFTFSPRVLHTRMAGLEFSNRVGMAAGFDKNADFFNEFSMFGFSFIEIGTVTPKAQPGNPKPRLFRLRNDLALINRMGFNNKGVEHAVGRLQKRNSHVIIGGNIGKNTGTPNESAAEDYAACFNALYDHVDYLAVNVSCPNIKGLEKLQDKESLRKILERIMTDRSNRIVRKPVFLKISPDLSFVQLDEIISLYHEVGLDGIIATNTTTIRNGLLTPRDTITAIGSGGLSGAPLKKRSLEMIRYICKQSGNSIPVIGVGGIMNPGDALEMINAGASLVQVYSGFIYEGPFLVRKINRALAKHFMQH